MRQHQHRPGTLTGLDEYLFSRTNGMIANLSQLVRGAAILAIQDGTEQDAVAALARSMPFGLARELPPVVDHGGRGGRPVIAAASLP